MKKKKRGSSYVGFAIICIILGSILISVGNFINYEYNKIDGDYIDVVAKISSYENLNDGKVNVICKYSIDNNEYNYVCHTVKKEDAMTLFKIGTDEKIKINKNNPGRITILNLEYVIIVLYSVGLIFLIIAIIYMINEVVRLIKRNKRYKEQEDLEK